MIHVVSGLCALHMWFSVYVVPFLHDFLGTFHSLELDSPTTPCLELPRPPQQTATVFSVLLASWYLILASILVPLRCIVIIDMLSTTSPVGLKPRVTVKAKYILLNKKVHG